MTSSAPTFAATCPSCHTAFPVDPDKVPDEGVRAICSACLRVFLVSAVESGLEPWQAAAPATPSVETAAPPPDDDESPRAVTPVEVVAETTEADVPAAETGPRDLEEVSASEVETADLEDSVPSETKSPDLEVSAPESQPQDVEAVEAPGGPSVAAGAARFGRRDPHDRARHLARVLVSDIIAYYPVKYREAFDRGTLQEEFRAEVDKSWKEYVDQVGREMAEETTYFKDALNQVLGKGKQIF